MCLAAKDDLDRPLGVIEDAGNAFQIMEDQHGPLVCSKTAGESDGKGIRIEKMVCTVKALRAFAMPEILLADALADEVNHLQLAFLMDFPQFLIGNGVNRIPLFVFFDILLPVGR